MFLNWCQNWLSKLGKLYLLLKLLKFRSADCSRGVLSETPKALLIFYRYSKTCSFSIIQTMKHVSYRILCSWAARQHLKTVIKTGTTRNISHKLKPYIWAQAEFRSRKHDSHIETCRHPCSHQFLWIPKVLLSQPFSLKQALILRSLVTGPSEPGLIILCLHRLQNWSDLSESQCGCADGERFHQHLLLRGSGSAVTVASPKRKGEKTEGKPFLDEGDERQISN